MPFLKVRVKECMKIDLHCEWLASVPIHYELFHVLGFMMPKYAHTAHLLRMGIH